MGWKEFCVMVIFMFAPCILISSHFISIPTNAHRSGIKLISKLLRHVAAFLHRPQGAYRFCQLKLWIIGLVWLAHHTHTHTRAHSHARAHTRTRARTHVHTTHIHTRARTHSLTHTHARTHAHAHVHIHSHTHMHTYSHTFTHTHAHTFMCSKHAEAYNKLIIKEDFVH